MQKFAGGGEDALVLSDFHRANYSQAVGSMKIFQRITDKYFG